jgi:hypothetical protein
MRCWETAHGAWLTPHAAVARIGGSMVNPFGDVDESCRFCFDVDGKVIHALLALSLSIFRDLRCCSSIIDG